MEGEAVTWESCLSAVTFAWQSPSARGRLIPSYYPLIPGWYNISLGGEKATLRGGGSCKAFEFILHLLCLTCLHLHTNIPSAEQMENSSLPSLAQLRDVVKSSFPSLEALLLPQG